nr:MAG TPA: hypothetical protein [Caudoviricetes sp.]
MNIVLKNLRTKVDAGKTKIELEHIFQPFANGAKELKVYCSYFRPGELTTYFTYDSDGKASADFQRIFRDKVSKIEGLSIETDKETIKIESAEDLLELPNLPVLSEIVMKTASHLISSDGLSEDEIKN